MQTTIVIPCYNEAGRLRKQEFSDYVSAHPETLFLFVNDGSKDATLEMLKQLCDENPQFEFLDVQPNGGKAEAVRRGMLYTVEHFDSEYVGFWDADLATPLFEIDNFLKEMQRGDYKMVTGLRLMRLGSGVQRKALRHLLGRCFATVASFMLHLPVYDTQCGSKLYKKEVVQPLFKDPFITRWLFDVEILSRYIYLFTLSSAQQHIYEYPLLQWKDVDGSQLKLKDFFKAPYELIKIKRKYNR